VAWIYTADERYLGGSVADGIDAPYYLNTTFRLAPGIFSAAYGNLTSGYTADIDIYSLGRLAAGVYTADVDYDTWDSWNAGYGGIAKFQILDASGYVVQTSYSTFSDIDFLVPYASDYYIRIEGGSYGFYNQQYSAKYSLNYANSPAIFSNATIDGSYEVGSTLTASVYVIDLNGIGPETYYWYADGQLVGQGSKTYTTTASDIGKQISVQFGYVDQSGFIELSQRYLGSVVIQPDSQAPILVSRFPSVDVPTAVDQILTFSFDESVYAGSGSIYLRTAAGQIVETFAAGSPSVVFFENSIFINPTNSLAYDTDYVIEFSANAVRDNAGNYFQPSGSLPFTTVEAPSSAVPASTAIPLANDPFIDAITNGYAWQLDETRTIDWSISSGFNGEYWTDPVMVYQYVNQALDWYSRYIDVNFNFVGWFEDPSAAYAASSEINISLDGAGEFISGTSIWAIGSFPATAWEGDYSGQAGDIFLNINSEANYLESYAPGSAGWFLLLHELGHTLGLKHPHDDGGTGRPTFSELGISGLDIDWVTIMSYADNWQQNLLTLDPATPMALDVLGLQYLYGVDSTWNAGDGSYNPGLYEDVYATYWDASGVDVIDTSSAGEGWFILLPDIRFSSEIDVLAGLATPVAEWDAGDPHTLTWLLGDIENVSGSGYADRITGNELDNRIEGGGGDDVFYASGGSDRIFGGAGEDLFRFSVGSKDDYVVSITNVSDEVGYAQGYRVATASGGSDVSLLFDVEFIEFEGEVFSFDDLIDSTSPYIVSATPLPGAVDIGVDSDFTVTLNEVVSWGDSSTYVRVKTDDGTEVWSAAAGDSQLSLSGNTITVNPTADLAYGTHYTVWIDAGFVVDGSGNESSALTPQSTNAYSFTTEERLQLLLPIDTQSTGDDLPWKLNVDAIVGRYGNGAGVTIDFEQGRVWITEHEEEYQTFDVSGLNRVALWEFRGEQSPEAYLDETYIVAVDQDAHVQWTPGDDEYRLSPGWNNYAYLPNSDVGDIVAAVVEGALTYTTAYGTTKVHNVGTVIDSAGNDLIIGSDADEVLRATYGAAVGGSGIDEYRGGEGNDIFRFQIAPSQFNEGSAVYLSDYSSGERIEIQHAGVDQSNFKSVIQVNYDAQADETKGHLVVDGYEVDSLFVVDGEWVIDQDGFGYDPTRWLPETSFSLYRPEEIDGLRSVGMAIIGDLSLGSTVSVAASIEDVLGAGVYRYQWYLDGEPVGTDSPYYTITEPETTGGEPRPILWSGGVPLSVELTYHDQLGIPHTYSVTEQIKPYDSAEGISLDVSLGDLGAAVFMQLAETGVDTFESAFDDFFMDGVRTFGQLGPILEGVSEGDDYWFTFASGHTVIARGVEVTPIIEDVSGTAVLHDPVILDPFGGRFEVEGTLNLSLQAGQDGYDVTIDSIENVTFTGDNFEDSSEQIRFTAFDLTGSAVSGSFETMYFADLSELGAVFSIDGDFSFTSDVDAYSFNSQSSTTEVTGTAEGFSLRVADGSFLDYRVPDALAKVIGDGLIKEELSLFTPRFSELSDRINFQALPDTYMPLAINTLGGDDVVELHSGGGSYLTIDTGAGSDTLSLAGMGSVGAVTLGEGDDTLVIADSDRFGGNTIDGGAGVDAADYSFLFSTDYEWGGALQKLSLSSVALYNASTDSTDVLNNFEFIQFADALVAINHAPELVNPLVDIEVPEDSVFSWTIPAGAFADADAGDSLTYSVELADGSAIPGWLTFDGQTLSGQPDDTHVGSYEIRVAASDVAGASAEESFRLTVLQVNTIATVTALDQSVAEGDGSEGMLFSWDVELDRAVDVDHEIDWSVSGAGEFGVSAEDFEGGVLPSGTLEIAAGQRTGTISFQVAGDGMVERDEGFEVTLSGTNGLDLSGVDTLGGMLLNDDKAKASIVAEAVTGAEGGVGETSTYTFEVELDQAVYAEQVVQWQLVDLVADIRGLASEDDFAGALSGEVVFAAGETSQTVTIEIAGDLEKEGRESFGIELFDPSSLLEVPTEATTVQIKDDDGYDLGGQVYFWGKGDPTKQWLMDGVEVGFASSSATYEEAINDAISSRNWGYDAQSGTYTVDLWADQIGYASAISFELADDPGISFQSALGEGWNVVTDSTGGAYNFSAMWTGEQNTQTSHDVFIGTFSMTLPEGGAGVTSHWLAGSISNDAGEQFENSWQYAFQFTNEGQTQVLETPSPDNGTYFIPSQVEGVHQVLLDKAVELRAESGDWSKEVRALTAADARETLLISLGKEVSGEALIAADVNKSGTVTAADARDILLMSVKDQTRLEDKLDWVFVSEDADLSGLTRRDVREGEDWVQGRTLYLQDDQTSENLVAILMGDVNASYTPLIPQIAEI